MKHTKKSLAAIAALVLAATLTACESGDDPNGTNGDTDTESTTTVIPDTTLGDVTTTTP